MHGDPSAEIHNRSNRKGVKAWHINAEKCFSFWVANQTDCSTCIRVCPFNKPKGTIHDLVRWSIRHLPGFNRFLVWADDRMGYGKWVTSKRFWKE
jgi:ferredoxin